MFVVFGTEEKLALEEAQEWDRYFQLKDIKEYPGNHFFIFDTDNKKEICGFIDQCFSRIGNSN